MKILILSDIHANIYALKTVLEETSNYDEIWVLGDLVDYGPNPGEVVDLVKSTSARVIRGNHDHAVGFGVDCRCGKETHWLSVWTRNNITYKLLSRNDIKYLASLPLNIVLDNALLVHGSPSNPLYGYLYPWINKEELLDSLKPARKYALRESLVSQPSYTWFFIGHTHYQFIITIEGLRVVNPGSVGQPRDGNPRASYAIVDLDENTIILKRVKYPIENVIREYEKLGVPEPYYSALKYMLLNGRIPQRKP
ncbi:MAG: metallophosphoesterase family protein [Thermoprotei archaeon]